MQSHFILDTEWRAIPGWEGLYEIARDARVRHIPTGRIKVATPEPRGYLYIHLWKNNRRKAVSLHRLIASAWLPNLENRKEINHKDGNKANCHVDNLEWSTRSLNLKHAYATGLRKRPPPSEGWRMTASRMASGLHHGHPGTKRGS